MLTDLFLARLNGGLNFFMTGLEFIRLLSIFNHMLVP